MRYVEGTDLRALLNRDGRIEPRRALDIAAQVGGALDAAHARGLVHRDVKPGNILIAPGVAGAPEHCYLTDFGLTKDTSSPVELTATGTFVGTIDYIAPEQIEGATPDGHGDQYALACVLFECLTGHPPFPRDQEIVVMWAHLQDEPPAVTADRPDLPPAIDAVITRAMAKAPGARFPSCTAMLDAARAALDPSAAPRDVTRARARPAPVTRVGAAAPKLAAPPLAAPPLAGPAAAAPAPVPAPPRPTVAPTRPARRAGLAPWLAVAGALVVVAAVAGALIGKGGDKATPNTGRLASNADLALRYQAPWVPGGAGDAVPGLTLADPIALRAGSARIVAGPIVKPGPGLLPAGVKASATDAVALGSTPALRYMGVTGAGNAPATVFVVVTDRGPDAIACVGAATSACNAVVATLQLRRSSPLDIEPSKAYATALSGVLGDQTRREAADRRALARAATSRDQATAAAAASRAQGDLAARARQLRPEMGRAANDAVAAALAKLARGYRLLATAARRHDAEGYRAASRLLRGAHADLADAIGALKLLGYDVQGGA
jgi:serine/threonine-protein kinase